jgi:hypothetical protein
LEVPSVISNGGEPAAIHEQPESNQGEFGKPTDEVITSAAEPRIHVRKLAENAPSFQAFNSLCEYIPSDANNRQVISDFAKDTLVPDSEKFLVVTIQWEHLAVDWFLLSAKSHAEAGAAVMTAQERKGLDPIVWYSTHIRHA